MCRAAGQRGLPASPPFALLMEPPSQEQGEVPTAGLCARLTGAQPRGLGNALLTLPGPSNLREAPSRAECHEAGWGGSCLEHVIPSPPFCSGRGILETRGVSSRGRWGSAGEQGLLAALRLGVTGGRLGHPPEASAIRHVTWQG